MTIKQNIKESAEKLSQAKITSANLDAEVLLSFVLKKPKEYLYTYPEKKLSKGQLKIYKSLIKQRIKGVPLAYLTNHKEFFGLDFYINEKVLIPEPETELLVEEILKAIPDIKRQILIADIGAGSGNLAITLAKHLPETKIYAVDISKDALKIAGKNAKKHQVKKQITFLAGHLLEPLPEKVDIIAANLPYIPSEKARSLKNRPLISIDGGRKGLKHIKSLLKSAPNYLKNNGWIFLEIDPGQVSAIKELASGARLPPGSRAPLAIPPGSRTPLAMKIKKDLAGLDRVVIIWL